MYGDKKYLITYMTKHNRIRSKYTTIKLCKKKTYRKPEFSLIKQQSKKIKTNMASHNKIESDDLCKVVENNAKADSNTDLNSNTDLDFNTDLNSNADLDFNADLNSNPDLDSNTDLDSNPDLDSNVDFVDNVDSSSDLETESPVELSQKLKPVFLNSKSLFQVSIHPDQFTHYQPITDIECIQSLCVLGLTQGVLKLHSKGTEWSETINYIQRSFGLQDGQVKHAWCPGTFSTPTLSEKINKQLQQLDDNFATILTLKIMSTGPPLKIWFHNAVAYKSGQIYYFDPQNNIHSTNPIDLSQNPKNTVIRFGMFYVKDVTTPIPLKTCI